MTSMHEPKHTHTPAVWHANAASAEEAPNHDVASFAAAAAAVGVDLGEGDRARDLVAAIPGMPPAGEALAGEVGFASQEEQVQRTAELLGAGALVVAVPAAPSSACGALAEHLDVYVEKELAARGAPSPYLAAWSAMTDDAETRLSDQLFRARTVGATGIALMLGSLGAIATPELTPDDSGTLRFLAQAAADAPLVVLIDDADMHLAGYEEPVGLHALIGRRRKAFLDEGAKVQALVQELVHEQEQEQEQELVPAAAPVACEEATVEAVEVAERTADETTVAAREADVAVAAREADVAVAAREAEEANVAAEADVAEAAEAAPVTIPEIVRATVGIPVARADERWRAWTLALGAARGPQPLGAFERLFAESYVPLANAIACGLEDPRALRAFDDFRRSFERAYSDAFATFGVTMRRPRLVMDAFEVASKVARAHNARAAHVLIVDSMRYDLGELVRDALGRQTAPVASLVSESILWSALPTTTMRQLETIARGIDALRAPVADDQSESLRGRSAEMVRRMRVGSREIYKLDLVPAMLGPAGTGTAEETLETLDEVAVAVAESLTRHIETLAPRTLLFVIGDHGFTVDRRGRVLTGGASPEEVLVPAHAWLIGELH